jgi:hypothetical protein
MSRALAITLMILGFSTPALADYQAVGPIEGNVCRGFIIEACGLHRIAAVKGDDGQLHEVQTRFASITEYKESSGRCWIRTKAKGGGLISWGLNAVKQPMFYERTTSGEYKELDVEYVTFKCVKR